MFEEFVTERIKRENEIAKKLLDSIMVGDVISKAGIVSSSLSDFTKNYLVNDQDSKITKDEVFIKIEKSNKLYFNYTIRPKWTLMTIFFNNFESRPPNEIMKKLKLFPFYNYYVDAINNFVKENSQIFLTKAEISSVIAETNRAVYQKLTSEVNSEKVKNFFLQIFRLKYGDEQYYNLESTIPYSFIRIFLDDKSFSDIEKKFHVVKGISDEFEISLIDIIKVMTDKYNTPVKEDIQETSTLTSKKEVPVETLKEVPLKEAQRKEDKKIKSIKQTEAADPPPDNKIYSEQLINAISENKDVNGDLGHVSGTKDNYEVRDLFSEKLLERISEMVYDSDLIYREKSFNKLSNFKTWFEASNHLKEIFKLNKVDIYNPDVIAFVDTLNEYYKNRE